jgi:eukaryotic-like serine/threonine-protein kinase
MPNEEAEGTGIATVADRPAAKDDSTVVLPQGHAAEVAGTIDTPDLEGARAKRPTPDLDTPRAKRPTPDLDSDKREPVKRAPTTPTVIDGGPDVANLTLTTASDALHDEEIDRTRLFIRLGWAISIGAIGVVPVLPAPRFMQIAMVAAMLLGIAVSFPLHQRFADPVKYTARALFGLAIVSVANSHVAVLYFGPFTLSPLIIVVGLHFLGRTEAITEARWVVAFACLSYAVIAGLVIAGVIADPGVFATPRHLSAATHAIGAGFVLGTYVLAFYTGRVFRTVSLVAIDELARATRAASQREALMAELRADLERALRIGGPGRYSEQTVGAFKLGIVLGRGAMGEVYEATHVTTQEPAAVKLLRRELLTDPTTVARFLREAKASGSLVSPHVVRVLDASPEDAALPYLAMERLHGVTLAELLRREPRLAGSTVVEVARHAGAGVDAAAAAGVVHRDLKPQNLFRTEAGIWKILDFGVATLGENASNLTQGGIVGTPSYMAPEQAQGKRVDGRADVYALAAVVYRCLTGRHPYSATDTPTLLYSVVHRTPLRPSSIAELHADVDACLAIALAKDPDDRFASGQAFAMALEAAIAGSLDPALRKRAAVLVRRLPWEEPA